MRRPIGVMLIAALAAALGPGIAFASPLSAPGASIDLRPQLLMRIFGETSDDRASLAAAYGDRTSESPLRDLALQVGPAHRLAAYVGDVSSLPSFAVTGAVAYTSDPFGLTRSLRNLDVASSARFQLPAVPHDYAAAESVVALPAAPRMAYTIGSYQPVDPVAIVSPAPGALSFGPLVRPQAAQTMTFNGVPGARASSGMVPATFHVGPVQVQARVEGASLQSDETALHDNAYGAGANFDLRAGSRNVNVDVSSTYEHLTRNDASTFSAPQVGGSSWQLPGADTPVVIPNFADVSKVSVGAAVAVPVVHGLTLNVNYGADRMFGGYGLPGLSNLDATDNSYGGRLTFAIPHSSSTLSISASQSRFLDSVLSSSAFTQTRGDVNFTVKF